MTTTGRPPILAPILGYRDGPGAIGFLKAAFGFEARLVVPGEGGTIRHAELSLDGASLLLHSLDTDHPRSDNHSVYLAVDDVDALHARAVAAGLAVDRPPRDTDYGSRDFGGRDPEGHIWNVGTYRPGDPT